MLFAIFISTIGGIVFIFLEIVVYVLNLAKKCIEYLGNLRRN